MSFVTQNLQSITKKATYLAAVPLLLLASVMAIILALPAHAAGPFPDTPVAGYPTANNTVYTTLVAADGSQYVGGRFTEIGGESRNCIARILADGTVDPDFDPNLEKPGGCVVFGLALDAATNTLYIGGEFETVNGSTTRNNFASVDATTGEVSDFDPDINSGVNAIVIDSTNDILYVSGQFDTADGGTTRNRVAAFDTTNGDLTDFDPNISSSAQTLALSPDGSTLYVGGFFGTVNGGTTRNNLAAFDTSTGIATSFDPNPNSSVNVILLDAANSTLYVGGDLTDVNSGTARNGLAALNTSTGIATSFDPNLYYTDWDSAGGAMGLLLDSSTDTLYVGGYFDQVNGSVTRNSLAAFDTSTGIATSFDPNLQHNSFGYASGLAFSPSGSTLYAGGQFQTVGGQARPNLAAFQSPNPTEVINNVVTNQPIELETPYGTTITCTDSVTEASLAAQDSSYEYPIGLVDFCFDTQETDNQVTLTFVTDLTPSQVTARKFNSNTNAYSTIPGATITQTTYNGDPALQLTYTITDNGPLDLDPTTGQIQDPVGLGTVQSGGGGSDNGGTGGGAAAGGANLASTGQNALLAVFLAAGLLTLGVLGTVFALKRRNSTI